MLVAFQTFAGDVLELHRLLKWCARLGPYPEHDALICADAATPYDKACEALKLAKAMFRTANITTNGESVIGWVEGPKSLFIKSCEVAAERGCPFLLMETDSIPLRRGWLDAVAAEYAGCGKPFMGYFYDCQQVGLPSRLMSGIGVYGIDIVEAFPAIRAGANWDVGMTEYVLPRAHSTKLIHHLWGSPEHKPSFARRAIPPDVFGLDQLPKDAVIWHRDKSQSLIRLLERQMFPAEFPTEPIAVCFNVHAGDIGLAVLHSKWLRQMGRQNQHKAYICHDSSCPIPPLNELHRELSAAFTSVEFFVYPRPPIPSYPQSANWAWQSIAHHMTHWKSPWFFFEADGIALKPDWLDQLQREYDEAGMSWMGSVVPHLGHVNGSAIYPPDAAHRMPRAMACLNDAWDMRAKDDMGTDRHDSKLFFHLWVLVNRMPRPLNEAGSEPPTNITAAEVQQWLPKEAVYVHRIKGSSLLEVLISGQFKP